MYGSAMELFLSKESLNLHLSYLNDLKLKYSILEKSLPCEKVRNFRSSLCDLKRDAQRLRREISLHEIYFSSFSEKKRKCEFLKRYYSSKEAFLYEIYIKAKSCASSFLTITVGKTGKPFVCETENLDSLEPCLALDLSEHAYFSDYAFNRDEYVRRALSYIDFSKLENK